MKYTDESVTTLELAPRLTSPSPTCAVSKPHHCSVFLSSTDDSGICPAVRFQVRPSSDSARPILLPPTEGAWGTKTPRQEDAEACRLVMFFVRLDDR